MGITQGIVRRGIAGIAAGLALLLACCGLSACAPGAGSSAKSSPTASPTKKRPAGPGGQGSRLYGGIWTFRELTVDGRTMNLTNTARPWLEFREDGTVAGSYACTPFHAKAELTATTLTLGEALPVPEPPMEGWGGCPTPEWTPNELEAYGTKARKFLHGGRLQLAEQPAEPVPGGPPPLARSPSSGTSAVTSSPSASSGPRTSST